MLMRNISSCFVVENNKTWKQRHQTADKVPVGLEISQFLAAEQDTLTPLLDAETHLQIYIWLNRVLEVHSLKQLESNHLVQTNMRLQNKQIKNKNLVQPSLGRSLALCREDGNIFSKPTQVTHRLAAFPHI